MCSEDTEVTADTLPEELLCLLLVVLLLKEQPSPVQISTGWKSTSPWLDLLQLCGSRWGNSCQA